MIALSLRVCNIQLLMQSRGNLKQRVTSVTSKAVLHHVWSHQTAGKSLCRIIPFHSFCMCAGQAQQAQLGTNWDNQMSPTSLVLCYPKLPVTK